MNAESLPYGRSEPTSGHAGSDTSRERAEADDRSGRTALRQRQTLEFLRTVGTVGATWRELADALRTGHGPASGILSNLHKDGKVSRLTERRGQSKVYVLPRYVMERPTEPHGVVSTTEIIDEMYRLLNEADQSGVITNINGWHDRANDVMRRVELRRG